MVDYGAMLSGANDWINKNPSTFASGLNLAAQFAGGDPDKISASQGFVNSMTANTEANKQKEAQTKQSDLLKEVLLKMSGGDPSAENTGGLTTLGLKPGKDGNIVATATGDFTTKDANAGMATATDLTSGSGGIREDKSILDLKPEGGKYDFEYGKTLRDLLPS